MDKVKVGDIVWVRGIVREIVSDMDGVYYKVFAVGDNWSHIRATDKTIMQTEQIKPDITSTGGSDGEIA